MFDTSVQKPDCFGYMLEDGNQMILMLLLGNSSWWKDGVSPAE